MKKERIFGILNRGDCVSTSEAKLRANRKHQQEKLEEIKFRVPKGNKARIQAYAQSCGESTNGFIYRAINETIARETGVPQPLPEQPE